MFWVYISLAAVVDSIGIILTKQFSESQDYRYLAAGMFCFALMAYFLGQSMSYEKMAIAIIIWAAFSLMVAFLVGAFFFAEKLTSYETVGFLVVALGLLIIHAKEIMALVK